MNRPNSKQECSLSTFPTKVADLFALNSSDDFLYFSHDLIMCKGNNDYQSMPQLGQLTTALYEFISQLNSEDIRHYIIYSENRWKDIGKFLQLIGAKKTAELFKNIINIFPQGRIPKDQTARLAEITRIQQEPTSSKIIEEMNRDWNNNLEEITILFQKYIKSHQQELEDLLNHRAQKTSLLNVKNLLSDDDLIEIAYKTNKDPFEEITSTLLDCDRLPLLLHLVSDKRCPTRSKLIAALYSISGNVGAQLVTGDTAIDLPKLKNAIHNAKNSQDAQLKEWALQSEAFLAAPTPEIILAWMGAVFLDT